MYTVVSQDRIGKYAVLELNNDIPKGKYSKYLIRGKTYDEVPVYDLPRHIAIVSNEDFAGEKVEFV